jgi:DNA polymerase III gamma/tau subunit
MASGDTIGSIDEVATIIGAPKSATVRNIIAALHDKDTATALSAVSDAVSAQVDMKLFARVLLDHLRAIMLTRNLPAHKDKVIAGFGEAAAAQITELAAGTTPINSHMLLRFLEATEQVGRSPIPQLPIELAIVDVCGK